MKTKQNKAEQELLVDILKGDLVYDMGKTIHDQWAFVDRIKTDCMSQRGNEKKITEAYLNQEQGKLMMMTKFIEDAISEATGKPYSTGLTHSVFLDYSIKLVITPKQ